MPASRIAAHQALVRWEQELLSPGVDLSRKGSDLTAEHDCRNIELTT